MNWSRFSGFMWGGLFGACLTIGFLHEPNGFLLAILPLAGNYFNRHVV